MVILLAREGDVSLGGRTWAPNVYAFSAGCYTVSVPSRLPRSSFHIYIVVYDVLSPLPKYFY